MPGMEAPYEESENPEVIKDSDKLDAVQCAQKILETRKNFQTPLPSRVTFKLNKRATSSFNRRTSVHEIYTSLRRLRKD